MKKDRPVQMGLFGDEWSASTKKPKNRSTKKTFQAQESEDGSFKLAQRVSGFLSEQCTSKIFASYAMSSRITWTNLFKWADEAFGGTQAAGAWTPKDAYDAMELGINLHLLELKIMDPANDLVNVDHARSVVLGLGNMLDLLPSQTKRTEEQQVFQQFSTPPHLAYIASWTAAINEKDVLLEPSAGIGGLAVFAKLAGAVVYVNELSARRRALLENLAFKGYFQENAEQLHNILPANIKPTVIVMNPPFSSSAGRIRSRGNKTQYAEAHLKQALLRLQEGGRLVSIVGRGMALDKPTFKDFWAEIKGKYDLKANIGIPGSEYQKYGTNFDNQIIVIDKIGPTMGNPLTGEVDSARNLLLALEKVRKSRSLQSEYAVSAKQDAHQPTKREKALQEYRKYVASLSSGQVEAVADLIEDEPSSPSLLITKIKNALIRASAPLQVHANQLEAADLVELTSTIKAYLKRDCGIHLYESEKDAKSALDAVGPRGAVETFPNYVLRIRHYQIEQKKASQQSKGEFVVAGYDDLGQQDSPISREEAIKLPVISTYLAVSNRQLDRICEIIRNNPDILQPGGDWASIKLSDKSELNFVIRNINEDGPVLNLEGFKSPGNYGIGYIGSTMPVNAAKKVIAQLFKEHEPKKSDTVEFDIGDLVHPKKNSGINEENGGRITHIRRDIDGSEFIQTENTGSMHFAASDWDLVSKAGEKTGAAETGDFDNSSKMEGEENDRSELHGTSGYDKQDAHQSEGLRTDGPTGRKDPAPLDTRHSGHPAGGGPKPGDHQKPPASTGPGADGRSHGSEPHRKDTRPDEHPADKQPGRPGLPGPGSPGPAPDRDGRGLPEPAGIDVQFADKHKADSEISESLYEHYRPRVQIAGTKPHPTPLVESAAMAAVDLPRPTYHPKLFKTSVESGVFSDAQIEQIIYAGQAHSTMLPADAGRKGYMIGDGTGVGKGREIAGILWDNWNHGRKKAVWITEKPTLFKDAQRDLLDVGWTQGAEKLFNLGRVKVGKRVQAEEGILFATYAILARDFKNIKPNVPETLQNMNIRLNQLVDWLGEEFQGVIVFDECHNMANAMAQSSEFGISQPSQKAMAGVMLQSLIPNARVLYVSATGATEIDNFAYLERLGLWGEGTAFSSKRAFISQIGAGGMASMELLASNMKAMGLYHARSLSWEGVEVDRLEHQLTDKQTEIYNKLAEAWQIVLHNINDAMGVTQVKNSGRERGAIYSRFWGAHQRFFNQVITAMQMPTILESAQKDIDAGHAVIFQLINTNEASLNRSLARMEEGDEYEDVDITPRDHLMEYIQHGFPIRQYEEWENDDGNVLVVPVIDSQGNHVINQQAVEMRDRLLEQLGGIMVPLGPLDMIIDKFGHDKVAEVTGRSKRIIYDAQKEQKVLQKRTNNSVIADMKAFKDDEKQILVFSKSGNTGLSFHADRTYKNHRKRKHYLVQPGWIAADAIQGIGRSHRSNQAHAPHYILCSTNLKGQKRFISSIARRLDQLGALTRGQRQTGGQGLFNSNDNLENDYARQGLRRFFEQLYHDNIPGLTLAQFEEQTGLTLTDSYGALKEELPPINQFLNRLLSMNIDQQNLTFAAFEQQMDEIVQAHAAAGTLDTGIETLKAKRVDKIDETVVHIDKKTGARAKYVQINVIKETDRISWEDILEKKGYAYGGGFCRNLQSGRIWAASRIRQKTKLNGSIVEVRDLLAPSGSRQSTEITYLDDPNKWESLTPDAAKGYWQLQFNEAPAERAEKRHIFTGSILPIWSHLKGPDRILRLQTSDGERLLGREVTDLFIDENLERLNARRKTEALTGMTIKKQVLDEGRTISLTNGWRIASLKVSGENRLEIIGPDAMDTDLLKKMGVFTEIISFKTRYFIPINDKTEDIINRVMQGNIIEDTSLNDNNQGRSGPRP